MSQVEVTRQKRILFVVDVENWAYDIRAKTWQRMLSGMYDIDIVYISDYHPVDKEEERTFRSIQPKWEAEQTMYRMFNHEDYDGILFFYYKALFDHRLKYTYIPRHKIATCINNEKWIVEGPETTYNNYFTDLKVLAACNQTIFKTFKPLKEDVMILSQLVDNNIFSIKRKHIISSRTGKNVIVGWSGNPNNPLKNVDILRRSCDSLGIKLDVQSQLSVSELSEWYNTLDMVACVSLPGQEGGPNLILEAGATALPVISTPVGLSKDIIESDENGILIPFDDQNSLTEAIDNLSRDVNLREKLSKNLQSDILFNWTYEKKLYQIQSVLERLIYD